MTMPYENDARDIKVAVIGCGRWGTNLVRNYAQLRVLKAVSDVNKNAAEKATFEYGVEARSIDEILQDDGIGAVALATPVSTHFEIASRALSSNKHVFVEKPLALTVQDARKLQKLAQLRQRVLMVGHLMRYHPGFLRLAYMASRGKLGNLRYIYSNRLNLGAFRTEENILWSFAPHDVSMVLAIAGEAPESVSAVGHSFISEHVADVTTTHLCFSKGVAAHIHVSWLNPFKEQRFVVIGSQGMAVLDDGLDWNEKLRIYPHRVVMNNGQPYPEAHAAEAYPLDPAEPLKLECEHFIDCIKFNREPITNAAESINTLAVLEAAQYSMESGELVQLGGGPKQ